jgi:hypothetical protein
VGRAYRKNGKVGIRVMKWTLSSVGRKTERKGLIGRRKRRWEDDIKVNLTEIGRRDVYILHVPQNNNH